MVINQYKKGLGLLTQIIIMESTFFDQYHIEIGICYDLFKEFDYYAKILICLNND